MLRTVLLGICLAAPSGYAFAEGQAIGLKVGALGLGVEYTYELNDRVAFRGGINGSQFGFHGDEGGIDYDFDVVWDSVSAAVDFHPLKTAFRVTGGFLKNDNRLKAASTPGGDITVGNTTYTPDEVGTLKGNIGFDGLAKFVGVGWDWSRGKRLFGMAFDIGLLDQGSPAVTLRGNGTLLGDPMFEQDVRDEEAELRDDLGGLELVPYASLGFMFRF